MRVPTRRAQLLKPGEDRHAPYHVTAAALKRMQDELVDLEKHQHPQVVEEVSRTRELGDFSENAEYQDAKFRLRRILGRIETLKHRIKQAAVIESSGVSGRVEIGSIVTLFHNGKQTGYTIVGPHETNPSRGRISHLSPLGSALLNHVVGETVQVKTQQGPTTYQIIEIK